MKRIRIRNRSRGTVLGERIEVANNFLTRLRGLLGRTGRLLVRSGLRFGRRRNGLVGY